MDGGARRAAPPRGGRLRRWVPAALAGLVSAGLTLGLAQLVAALVAPSTAPLAVVGAAFIDRTPAWLKDFAIETFGTNDKLALAVSLVAVIAALAVVAGLAARRHLGAGIALVGLLGAVGVAAALSRPDATALSPLPTLVGTAAGIAALVLLTRRAVRPVAVAPARRSLLIGGVAAVGAVAAGSGRGLEAARSSEASRAQLTLPVPADPAPAPPPGVNPGVEGLTPYVTPVEDFYRIDTAFLQVPDVRAEDWSLRIHGMVEEEVVLTYADLLAAPLVERWITLTCVSNEVGGELVGNARWLGIPLADVLRRAVPSADADMLLSRSTDGFTTSTTLADVVDGRDALLAIGMNGVPLPREHGFPVRMIVPGLYGFVSACKWITEIEVTRFDRAEAYWTKRGWSPSAPIKTASRIDTPRSFAKVPAGTVTVAGVAWAQNRGVSAVEVRVDDGEWRRAEVLPSVSEDTWAQWVWRWEDVEPGSYTLRVRATDATGVVQTGETATPIPDGASGYDTLVFTVV
ncbi:DMSO/TMAO reductase YedYZ molybdopterin-dependent catalytic subunit [Kineococcus xinjiangensis]|uniref:DMSO/TMAO reductase YedYZ molybdopterin-dependent catalytic subunit n=1 Tax=Kineococcus xinjiangensis TaxID=512762 RepID=A0A2S6ICP2_9ACTN|nr:molybdopterin-dependent oxidoreductase [Kineococcus xinjiangensis]PPK91992.1 DMSO/TMAO reductase YedYZ molybdopterin-dependent catalytic subunit [Kineococcus xinjiangensis]